MPAPMTRLFLFLAAMLVPLAAQAGDAAAGKKRATACQTCHGMDGLSKMPEAPNIAGQVEPYLVKQLTDYRDGKRSNEIMNVVAKDLSDKNPGKALKPKFIMSLSPCYIGLPQGEPELLHWLDTYVHLGWLDGSLSALSEKWLGTKITSLPAI